MQTSLSPPWSYAVYLKGYPDGGYAYNAEPYALEIFLLPCGLRDTLAFIPLSLEIFYILRLVVSYPRTSHHEAMGVDSVWRTGHQRADIMLRQDHEL